MAAGAEVPTGTVTFLFTDVEGSTRLWEQRPDVMKVALARHDAALRAAVEVAGGIVFSTAGDGVGAVFARVVDAVTAAVGAQCEFASFDWPDGVALRVRMGLHVGEAQERDGDYFGPAVNRAARLMAAAHGGQIVCSRAVADVVRDALPTGVTMLELGEHRLRDIERSEWVFQIHHPALARDFPPLRSLGPPSSNLPAELSAFVGRENDVAGVAALLGESRAVTIVGVGGVGKTRLALRVARELLDRYPQGVWLCELASVPGDGDVIGAVAAALGYVPPQGTKVSEGLPRFLEHKRLLMVLDNCEHVVDSAATMVSETLSASPGVTILATSREALGVPGEHIYPLGSLSLPAAPDPDSVARSDAGTLFGLRAGEARGSFTVDVDNAAAIRDVCIRLDGIALAIELAAARTAAMTPAEVASRLDQQFRILAGRSRAAPERHQTLRTAIDWSYDLLDDDERALLDRCSVFVGGFDLPAAIAIAATAGLDDIDAADRIASLVAKSLVERSERGGVTRFRLLEMIRQYAAEHLDASGDAARVREAHANHYLAVATSQFARALTPAAWEALDDLERDESNLAAGGMWLLDNDRRAELFRFFGDMPFVDSTALPASVLDSLGRLAAAGLAEPSAPSWPGVSEACFMAAMRHFFDGDTVAYQRYADIGMALPGNPSVRVLTLAASAAMIASGDYDTAIDLGKRAVHAAGDATPLDEVVFALSLLGVMEVLAFPEAARAHAAEAVALARDAGGPIPLLYALLAVTMAEQNADRERALAAAEECVRIDRSQRRTWSQACRILTAKFRLDLGDLLGGYCDIRESLADLAREGDRTMLSAQVLFLADTIASTSPALALQLAAIYQSDAIAAWGDLRYQPAVAALAEERAEELDAARASVSGMTYDDAITFVLAVVDGLIASCPRARLVD